VNNKNRHSHLFDSRFGKDFVIKLDDHVLDEDKRMKNQEIQDTIFFMDPNPGGNQVVLLIHGLGSDHSSWYFQVEELIKEGFRPIMVDLPGFGRSNNHGKNWNLGFCVRECIRVLDVLEINQAVVCGISLGGVVAQLMAIQNPERVKQLILINTFTCLRPQKADEWIYLLRRYVVSMIQGKDKQAELVAERLFPGHNQDYYRQEVINQIRKADPDVYKKALKALGLLDIRKSVKNIRVETLVITAENDTTVPVRNQVELAGLIPGAKQVLIPDSRHAVIIDQPEKTNHEMMRFLKR
jgi:3-oxoadipate enol-lactonase